MGVVFACALSIMSKYLHQSCGPKPMTRVDINENNQSSNKYNLRSKQKEGKPSTSNQPRKSENSAKIVTTTSKENEEPENQPVIKAPIPEIKYILKSPYSFRFENEIHKIKIPIPLLELIENEEFKRYISKMMQPEPTSHSIDSVNLQDEKPTVILGPLVEDRDDSSPPFYTSLNIHDKILHNFLMDLGSSHKLMPKTFMDELDLEITKTCHDLYSFDFRKVKFLEVIKDLVVTLFQLPMKSVVMDIGVVDVPPKFGMLLSMYWIKILGETLQMDLSYSTNIVFGGEHKRLYKEE
jgi:hypothetical protein